MLVYCHLSAGVCKFISITFLFGPSKIMTWKGCLLWNRLLCFVRLIPVFAESSDVLKVSVALRLDSFGVRKEKTWANGCMFSSGFCVCSRDAGSVMLLFLFGGGNRVSMNDINLNILT